LAALLQLAIGHLLPQVRKRESQAFWIKFPALITQISDPQQLVEALERGPFHVSYGS
jgi:hypothetical protein